MIYGSVCSGIESASIAWEPLGWSPVWFAEIEPFPSAVLAHHWPRVANLGDMCNLPTLIRYGLIKAPDVLVGGTPCQAFSVAGMRGGLEDERGQLTIKYVEVANAIDKKRPKGKECIIVWENVPGVLSSKDNAFGCFLAALVGENGPLQPPGKKWSNAGIVYGPQRVAAWRILDAQYFGVAQRRRRVFVIASARDGFNPAEVLFESESLRRDTPPSRETGEGFTGNAGESAAVCTGNGYYRDANKIAAPVRATDNPKDSTIVFRTANTKANGIGVDKELAYTLDGAQGWAVAFQSKASHTNSMNPSSIAPTLDVGKSDGIAVAFQQNASGEVRTGKKAYTLNTNSNASGRNTGMVHDNMQVRRLTPKECERLQGFPDDHVLIPWRGKPIEDCPDGPRYKAIGNSKAVPVIQWIGRRIDNAIK